MVRSSLLPHVSVALTSIQTIVLNSRLSQKLIKNDKFNDLIQKPNTASNMIILILSAYPMRIPAWPVLFETVNSISSWSAGEDIGVYCGQ